MPKLRAQARWGRLLLLGMGGAAAACGALLLYRARSRSLGNLDMSPVTPAFPGTVPPGPESRNWSPDQAPDEVPAPEPALAAAEPGPGAQPAPEPWMDPLRQAMELSPHEFGYGKSGWTAPLLGRYLQDVRGFDVPVPLLRKALKDLGYQWEHSRYVPARTVKG